MVSEKAILDYLAQFDDVTVTEQLIEDKQSMVAKRGERICVVVEKNMNPLRVELRCDRKLSETLQARYESVMESRALGRNGIEIICSGQLSDDEVMDLVRHGYEMSAPEAE